MVEKITQRTLVPVGVIGVIVAFVLGFALQVNAWAVSDAVWKARVDDKLTALEAQTIANGDSRWKRRDQAAWATILQSSNPQLAVPSIPLSD